MLTKHTSHLQEQLQHTTSITKKFLGLKLITTSTGKIIQTHFTTISCSMFHS